MIRSDNEKTTSIKLNLIKHHDSLRTQSSNSPSNSFTFSQNIFYRLINRPIDWALKRISESDTVNPIDLYESWTVQQ